MAMSRFGTESAEIAVIEHLMMTGEMVAAQLPSASRWSPERKLAGTVLASTLIEVRDRYRDPRYRRQVAEDLEWILSDDLEWPYSFIPLCHLFGLEPEYVRQVVDRWRQTERPQVQRQCSAHRHAA